MANCKKLSLSLSFLLVAQACCIPAALAATKSVAKVIGVTGSAYAVSGASKRPLQRRSDIFPGETIQTEDNTKVQIRFLDDALVSLKENSRFIVDNYHYDAYSPEKNKSAMSLVQGGFWSVTGQIADVSKDAYSVSTNFTTIGVRGTYYGVAIQGKPEKSSKKARHGRKATRNQHYKQVHAQLDSDLNLFNDSDSGYSAGESKKNLGNSKKNKPNDASEDLTDNKPSGPKVEVFAVLDGGITVNNKQTGDSVDMAPGSNQFVQLTGPREEFQLLDSMPSSLQHFSSDLKSDEVTKASSITSRKLLVNGEDGTKNTEDLALQEPILIFNTTSNLINPPGFPNTDNNGNLANNSTVALTTAELNSLLSFGAAANQQLGRGIIAGLSNGAPNGGDALITNTFDKGAITRVLSKNNAIATTVGSCNQPVCAHNVQGQTINYGTWSSSGSLAALLRDGTNSNLVSQNTVWAVGSSPLSQLALDSLISGNVSRSFTGTPTYHGVEQLNTTFEVNFNVNFGNPTAEIPVSVEAHLGSPNPTQWNATFLANLVNGKLVSTTVSPVGNNTAVNTGLAFNEPVIRGSLDAGFLGNANVALGAVELGTSNRQTNFLFFQSAN